jgi:hypothetical protein
VGCCPRPQRPAAPAWRCPVVTYQDLCRELTRAGPGCAGALSTVGARSILRRFSDAWFCAAARRRDGDGRAHFPRRRRSLRPSRYYAGTLSLEGRRLTLPVARGRSAPDPPHPPLPLRRVLRALGHPDQCPDPAAIYPAGPGVTHDGSRWITIVACWVPGPLWPAPRTSWSRSIETLRLPDRGITGSAPKGVKVGGDCTRHR